MTALVHVLLVEDSQADADLTRETLQQSRLQLELAVAPDGATALERLHRRGAHVTTSRPDLVLLDLNLPGISGREVLAEMKSSEALRAIPVVVLTSSDAEVDVAKSYELGAACYLTKPVGLAAYRSIVRSIDDFWLTVVKLPR